MARGKVVLDQPINSAGFRDREYPHAKDRDTFRIVVLGDSFTDQLEIPTRQLYHEVLERKLNSTAIRRFEVINLGVAGFGTAQEYLTLKCYGLQYNPDLVILAFYVGNDIFNNSMALHEQYSISSSWRPFFQLVDGQLKLERAATVQRPSLVKRIVSRVLPRSYSVLSQGKRSLARFFRAPREESIDNRVRDALSPALDAHYRLYQEPHAPAWEDAWAITKALILELVAELNRSHTSFLVVVIPDELEFRADRWQQLLIKHPQLRALRFDLRKPERILSKFLRDNRVSYLLLRPAFERRTKDTGEDLHFHLPGDTHWNTQGHALAASEIFEKLVRDGLVRATAVR